MERRILGRTRLEVTRLGLGLAALGRPGYINLGHGQDMHGQYSVLAMEARCHRVLDAAWEAGLRYFDAARSYGRAERFLASWLLARNVEPREVAVASKWGYTYTADWEVRAPVHEVKDHTAPTLRRQWEETRSLLGSQVDLYQIHSATLDSGALEDRHVIANLGRLRDEGVQVGLSLSGAAQSDTLRRAMDVRWEGEPLFGAVQATWNLLEPSAGPALAEAHAAGMGVVVKEALANGRLTDRNRDPAQAGRLEALRAEAERLHTTVDALAMAAALAQPWADVVLSGAASPEQVASNVRALCVRWDDAAASRLAALAESPETYWDRRSRMEWN